MNLIKEIRFYGKIYIINIYQICLHILFCNKFDTTYNYQRKKNLEGIIPLYNDPLPKENNLIYSNVNDPPGSMCSNIRSNNKTNSAQGTRPTQGLLNN